MEHHASESDAACASKEAFMKRLYAFVVAAVLVALGAPCRRGMVSM